MRKRGAVGKNGARQERADAERVGERVFWRLPAREGLAHARGHGGPYGERDAGLGEARRDPQGVEQSAVSGRETIGAAWDAGCDVFVAGNAVYGAKGEDREGAYRAAIEALRAGCEVQS